MFPGLAADQCCALTGAVIVEGLLPGKIKRKAATGQYDALVRQHTAPAFWCQHFRTDDMASVVSDERSHRAVEPDRHAEFARRPKQSRGQRIAVGQQHRPAPHGAVEPEFDQTFGDVEEGFQPLRGAIEVPKLFNRADCEAIER